MSTLLAVHHAVFGYGPDNPAAPDLGAYAPGAAPAPSFDQMAGEIYARRRRDRAARALGHAAAPLPHDDALEAEHELDSHAIIARRRRARSAGAA